MTTLSHRGAFTLLACACLTIMVGCIIVPGLTEIASRLGTPAAASWLVTVPSLGVVTFGPLAGKLIGRFGAWRALVWGLFFYGLLGAGAIFLHGMVAVMADRLLLGGATAVVMSAGTALIATFYKGQARLKAIALQGMSIELGGVIFLFAGGMLALAGWQWPFSLYLFAWLLLAMVLRYIPEPQSPAGDISGEKSPEPFVDPALRSVYLTALLSTLCFFTAVVTLPHTLHQRNFSAASIGNFLSFVSLMAVGAAALMPRVLTKIKLAGTLSAAFILYALAHLTFYFADSLSLLVAAGAMMGCGFGLSIPLVNHVTIERSSPARRGQALARLSMAIFSGQFLSSFMASLPGGAAVPFLGAMTVAAIAAVISAVPGLAKSF